MLPIVIVQYERSCPFVQAPPSELAEPVQNEVVAASPSHSAPPPLHWVSQLCCMQVSMDVSAVVQPDPFDFCSQAEDIAAEQLKLSPAGQAQDR